MANPFICVSPEQCLVTSGVESTSPFGAPIAFSGLSTGASAAPPLPAVSEKVSAFTDGTHPGQILGADGSYYPAPTDNRLSYFDPLGSIIASGQVLTTQQAGLTPGIGIYGETSYTGSNLRVMIEVANSGVDGTTLRLAKQLYELTTLSVSVFRVKTPAVACGYINAKGYARGRRTVGGTMVLTKFTTDALYSFLLPGYITADTSNDSVYVKVDQLPPFNLTLLFGDEYGRASFQRLLGVELVTSGDVYSIQDMLSEQTLSFVAADFTPLLPLTQNALAKQAANTAAATPQNTVQAVMSKQLSVATYPFAHIQPSSFGLVMTGASPETAKPNTAI